MLGQQREGGMTRRWGEHGGDRGLLGAGPHQALLGAGTECEAETVEQDRLAGAGFAGQDGEARTEAEVKAFDQHDVADRERRQHGAASGDEGAGFRTPTATAA